MELAFWLDWFKTAAVWFWWKLPSLQGAAKCMHRQGEQNRRRQPVGQPRVLRLRFFIIPDSIAALELAIRRSHGPPVTAGGSVFNFPQPKTALVQIEVAQRLPCIGSIFGALHSFLEFAFKKIGLVSLGIYGLAKERFLSSFLFAHRARSFFEVIERLWTRRRRVRDDGSCLRVDLEQRSAARTPYFEGIDLCFTHDDCLRG